MKNKEGYPDPTAAYAINGVRWEELQRMREKEHGIKRGETLTLRIAEREEGSGAVRTKQRRMKVIELYKHFALLESSIGIRESMSYWKLEKCMSKAGGGSSGQREY